VARIVCGNPGHIQEGDAGISREDSIPLNMSVNEG
jgi:hypothetical protein